MALSLGLGSTGTPKMTHCTLNGQISLIVASIFHISAVYGPIRFCFGYDALVGLCYHTSGAHDPINRFKGPLLEGHLLRKHLFRRHLLSRRLLIGCLSRQCLSRDVISYVKMNASGSFAPCSGALVCLSLA